MAILIFFQNPSHLKCSTTSPLCHFAVPITIILAQMERVGYYGSISHDKSSNS